MKFVALFLTLLSVSLFSQDIAPQTDFYANLDISYTRVYLKPQGLSHLKGNMVGIEGNDDSKQNLFDGEIYQRLGHTFTFFGSRFLLTPY